jgi:putative membrane protein
MAWNPHPDVLILIALIGGGYAALALRGTRRAPDLNIVTRRQLLLFYGGVFAIWIAAGTPIHDWGEEYLFSVHMVEHLLLSMVAAPLLVLGTPGWMVRPFLTNRRVFPVAKFLTFWLVAIMLYNGYTVFSHWPGVMDFILEHHAWHFVSHIALMFTAVLLWWPVFSPLPELPRMHFAGQMIYLFVQSLVPSIVASFLTFGTTPLYSFYVNAPRRWGLSPIDDQVMSGLIMKIFGGTLIFVLMSIIFLRWYAHDEELDPDPLERLDRLGPGALNGDVDWSEVEQELARMGLTSAGRGGKAP